MTVESFLRLRSLGAETLARSLGRASLEILRFRENGCKGASSKD